MAKLNVPTTKTALLRIKKELEFSREGFDLLEQKREILVIELMHRLEKARYIEKEVAEKLEAAYDALRQAVLRMGRSTAEAMALSVRYDHEVTLSEHYLMGISLPEVRGEYEPFGLRFSLHESSAWADECMKRFLHVLDSIGRLAQIENAVIRLARELRKTQRRVNALEKIFIPNYEDTVKFIEGAMEGKELEGFFTTKLIKRKLSVRRRAKPASDAAPNEIARGRNGPSSEERKK
jgi:V/A-type H+-transporting ATPase subunit D